MTSAIIVLVSLSIIGFIFVSFRQYIDTLTKENERLCTELGNKESRFAQVAKDRDDLTVKYDSCVFELNRLNNIQEQYNTAVEYQRGLLADVSVLKERLEALVEERQEQQALQLESDARIDELYVEIEALKAERDMFAAEANAGKADRETLATITEAHSKTVDLLNQCRDMANIALSSKRNSEYRKTLELIKNVG